MNGGCKSVRFVLSTPVTRAAAVLIVLAAIAGTAPALAVSVPVRATGECFVHSLPAAHSDVIDVQWLAGEPPVPPLTILPAPLPSPPTDAVAAVSNVTAPRTPPPRLSL